MTQEIVVLLVLAQGLVDFLVVAFLIGVQCELDKANTAIAELKVQDKTQPSPTAGDGAAHVAPSGRVSTAIERERADEAGEAAPVVTNQVLVTAARGAVVPPARVG